MVYDIVIGAESLEFDSRVCQIGHRRQRLATTATFLCCLGAKPPRWAPPLVTPFDIVQQAKWRFDFDNGRVFKKRFRDLVPALICGKLRKSSIFQFYNSSDGRVIKASSSGAVDLGLIPSRVKPMALKLVFTASCLTLRVKGIMWRTSLQVYLLCRWKRHLAGFPHLGVVDRWPATP